MFRFKAFCKTMLGIVAIGVGVCDVVLGIPLAIASSDELVNGKNKSQDTKVTSDEAEVNSEEEFDGSEGTDESV